MSNLFTCFLSYQHFLALWYFPGAIFTKGINRLSVFLSRLNLKNLHSKSHYLSRYWAFSTIQPHYSPICPYNSVKNAFNNKRGKYDNFLKLKQKISPGKIPESPFFFWGEWTFTKYQLSFYPWYLWGCGSWSSTGGHYANSDGNREKNQSDRWGGYPIGSGGIESANKFIVQAVSQNYGLLFSPRLLVHSHAWGLIENHRISNWPYLS